MIVADSLWVGVSGIVLLVLLMVLLVHWMHR